MAGFKMREVMLDCARLIERRHRPMRRFWIPDGKGESL